MSEAGQVPKKPCRIGWNPEPIAREIINIFAKYEMPINFKDKVYKTVDELLGFQRTMPVEVDAVKRGEYTSLFQSALDDKTIRLDG